MKVYEKYLIFSLLLILTGVFAQSAARADDNPTFSQQELDQMLAPVALYPDALLSQILMAATYPLEVVEAARWLSANPGLSGDAAVQAVDSQSWDPSIKALVAFPQVLQTLNQNIEWTERLGDAFLAQQSQVMDTVQSLRQKAQQAGNLNSNSQIQVTQSDGGIEVAMNNPDVIYVPYYDPALVYGTWWWPDYPPPFWARRAGYGRNGGIVWGRGIDVGTDIFSGSWDWRNHAVYAHNTRDSGENRPWRHDPDHRHGVPYPDTSLYRQYGRVIATPASRTMFRGYERPVAARLGAGGKRFPIQPIPRTHVPETLQPLVPRRVSPPPAAPRPRVNPLPVVPRAQAFENVGRGAEVRNYSARGHTSLSGRSSAPSPGPSSAPSHLEHR